MHNNARTMNENTIVDLKQFITDTFTNKLAAALAQQNIEWEKKLDQKLDEKLDERFAWFEQRFTVKMELMMDSKVAELSNFIADALDVNMADIEKRLNNHEHRIVRLEHKPG